MPTSNSLPSLEVVTGDDAPSDVYPLGECQGDCERTSQCEDELVCYKRWEDESVPGCAGPGTTGANYCVDLPPNYLFFFKGNPPNNTLSICEGDCDIDAECIGDLVCFQRDDYEEVPLCYGDGRRNTDYCIKPPGPTTYPFLTLLSPNPYAFNPTAVQVCIEISNALFDKDSVSLVINQETTSPEVGDSSVCIDSVFESTSHESTNTLEFTALDSTGTYSLSLSREIYAGDDPKTVHLFDEQGNDFLSQTTIEARISGDELVKSTPVTTDDGIATLSNVPYRTIIVEAEGPQGELGVGSFFGGGILDMVLKGFNNPSAVDNKDFSLGSDGWTFKGDGDVYRIVSHEEDVGPDGTRRLDIDQDLVIETTTEGESSASYTFTSSLDACAIRVRYRFQTEEVPGFSPGDETDDFYSVSIRAQNSGKKKVEANTISGLGLSAFDPDTGSTRWMEVILAPDPSFGGPDTVQVDVAVANADDDSADSQVVIDFVEEVIEDSSQDNEPCACAQCQAWHGEEIKDTAWVDDLPTCPCSIVQWPFDCTVRPSGSDVLTGELDGVDWDTDEAMNPCVDLGLHPGAYACIRAAGPNGTGQQCCYGAPDASGVSSILEHGTSGAGTPVRYNFADHQGRGDLANFNRCCSACADNCALYIGETDGTQGARSDPRHSSAGCSLAN